MNKTFSKYLTLIILGFAGGSIYAFPYLKYVFYDQMIDVMNISNTQAGFLLSMYAIGCMILYIPGGMLADRISPKKSLVVSLLINTALTVIYAVTFDYTVSLVIWLLLAFSSGFVFWSALLKVIRMSGDEDEQGRLYGIYYASNGITAAVVNFISLWVFSLFPDERTGFFWAIIVMALFTGIVAVLLAILMKEDKELAKAKVLSENDKFHFKDVITVLKTPIIWLISLLFFCTYGIYTCQSYFAPYLTDVIKIDTNTSGILSIFRTYVFMLLAPFSGFIADKLFHSTLKWFVAGFILLALSIGSLIVTGISASSILISTITLIIGLISLLLYSVMFSTMSEVHMPIKTAGTAIGIASIFGYAPDLFMNTIFGNILDNNGDAGYYTIFITLIGFCVAAAVICLLLLHMKKRKISAN